MSVQVPTGDWYCSHECEKLKEQINSLVAAGDVQCSPVHSWQLLRGKDGNEATKRALQAAGDILQSSFDPIMDAASNMDLLPLIIKAKVRMVVIAVPIVYGAVHKGLHNFGMALQYARVCVVVKVLSMRNDKELTAVDTKMLFANCDMLSFTRWCFSDIPVD